ncbi:MAG: hypothetical protein ACO1TE_28115 [Prosthecobacter sp.]
MKFYLKIFIIFGLFIAAAANFPRLATWVKKRDLEGTAKTRILATVKDPATVKWNAKRITTSGTTTTLTYDITADKIEGGMAREVWTFEFNKDTGDILSVKQSSPQLNIGFGPAVEVPKKLSP